MSGVWAAYSPDGRHAAAGGDDGHVAIIDTETGQLVREPVHAHGDFVPWVAFSDDGSRLASGAGDGTVVLWDAATGNVAGRITPDRVEVDRPDVPAERQHHDRPV